MLIGKNIDDTKIINLIGRKAKGNFAILMKILTKQINHSVIENFDLLLETGDFIFSFSIFRQIQKESPDIKHLDPSLDFYPDMFWSKMIKGEVNEAMHDIYDHSKKQIFSFQDVGLQNPLQANLKKLMKRESPFLEKAVFWLIQICLIIFATTTVSPLFNLSINIGKVVNVPQILRKSLSVGILWSRLMTGIEHSVNCTMYNDLTFDIVIDRLKIHVFEQSYVTHTVIGDFNRNMGPIAILATNEITEMNKYLSQLRSDSFSKHISKIWYMPKILFRLYLNGNQTLMDMRSILSFYLAEIVTYYDPRNGIINSNWCNTPLTKHFKPNMASFMNTSIEILTLYNEFVNSYQNYIIKINDRYKVTTTNPQQIVIFVFFAASQVFNFLWNYMSFKRLYTTMVENFRIQVHPNYENIFFEEKVSRMSIFKEMFVTTAINIMCGILFIAVTFLVKIEANNIYDRMMKYNMISVRLENLSLTFTITLHSYFRSYLFDDTNTETRFKLKINDLEFAINELDASFSPLNLILFKNINNLPGIMQYHESDHFLSSMHDIYNEWPIMHLVYLTHSLISDSPKLLPPNPNTDFFLHISHIYNAHFQSGINQVHEIISKFSEDQSNILGFIILLGIVLFLIYLFGAFFMLYRKYVRMRKCHKILNSYILNLDPVFLLTQKSLMDYLLATKRENLTSIKHMKELFTAANVPVLFIGNNDTIVQYSKPIIKMFGMRDDQLIGHSLSMIIQDDTRKFAIHIHKRIDSIHNVKGINSNDELFNIEAKITSLRSYVLLELKMMDEIMDIEELIQVHSDLYNEYISTSFLWSMVQQSNLIYPDIYQRTFQKFSFLIIKVDSYTAENEINIELLKHYFSECIVLFFDFSLWISIFVGENPILEAIRCYQIFGMNDDRKAGVILEGNCLTVQFFGLSENIDWIDPRDIMTSVPPHVSIEPKLDLINYLQYIDKIVLGKLVGCKSMSIYFEESTISSNESGLVSIFNQDITEIQLFMR